MTLQRTFRALNSQCNGCMIFRLAFTDIDGRPGEGFHANFAACVNSPPGNATPWPIDGGKPHRDGFDQRGKTPETEMDPPNHKLSQLVCDLDAARCYLYFHFVLEWYDNPTIRDCERLNK